MRRLIGLVVVALVGVGVPAVAAGATGSVVSITSCGQVVTTDAVLRTDLICSGTGLAIEASNVSVRLTGHSITSSDGTGVGISFGMTNSPCVTNASVTGGQVSGFASGISGVTGLCSTTSDRVSAMTLTDNTWGLWAGGDFIFDVDHTTIVGPNGVGPTTKAAGLPLGMVHLVHSTIDVTDPTGYSVATSEDYTPGVTIDSSRLDGGMIWLPDATVDISHSDLRNVTVACSNGNIAITDTRMIDSTVPDTSICNVTLSGDHIAGPGSGLFMPLWSYNFAASFTGNVFSGWTTAVQIGAADRLVISGNTFRHNGTGVLCAGCEAGSTTGPPSPSVATVTSNRFIDNTGDGLQIAATQRSNWGIGSNVALRNGGLGIDAPAGLGFTITDLGGNVARHNQPPQCIGVVCTH